MWSSCALACRRPPRPTGSTGSRRASTSCSRRRRSGRPHDARAADSDGRADQAVPARRLAVPARQHLQVPPELLRVRRACDPPARCPAGRAARGVAAAALQPVVARRRRLPVMPLFSILSPLENVMKSILDFFHGSVGLPWAWSIVALTVLVRILLVPLTVRQIHSMQSLQAHAPEMKAIQQKYKGDRQKLNEELMKFYRENHINPAASCLPLLAQFPVFIALYFTLKNNTAHITGSWLHVVPNISDKGTAHWSDYVLLAVYAGSQVASTYFMGATMDKTQRNIMMVLPLVFITVVSRFPTGLIIYWMTTNLWTVGQGLVTRRLVPKTPAPKLPSLSGSKRSSRTPAKADDPPENGGPAAETPKAPAAPRRVKRKKGGARR